MAQEPDLLISAGFSDAQLVAESNKVVAAFKRRGEEAQKAFNDATGRVTNTTAARAHMRELDRLSKAYDPVYRAASRYETEVKKLDRALDLGAITQAQYTTKVAEAAREMQQASAAAGAGAGAMAAGASRAQRSVQALDRGMTVAGRGFQSMRGQVQNTAFQLQDFVVQVQGGTAASVAFAQQAPQLLGGFGALGAVLGLVAALAVPVGAALLGTREKAKTLDDAIKDLNRSLESYHEAVEAANVPTSELIERYGAAAGAAQRLLEQLAQIAKLDAASALRESAGAIRENYEDLPSILALVDAELEQFGEGSSGLETLADSLREKFGLTIDQARELQSILTDQQAATTVEAQAAAMLRLAEFLGQANEQAGYTNDSLIESNRSAAEGALAANEMAAALDGAAAAADGVAGAVSSLPGSIDQATASAINLSRALALAIGAAQSMPGSLAPSLDRFGDGQDITRRAGGMDLQEQQTFRYDWQAKLAELERSRGSGSHGGGRGSRSAGAGRPTAAAMQPSPGESMQDDLASLEREISLLGKSNEEVAVARARWAALDEAKRRGIPVTAEMSAQIDAQAAQFGRLTAELERAEAAQQQFDQAINGVASAMAGALVAGESLRDGLAQVLKGIAADIINSGIRQALMAQFAGGGGAGGLLGFLGPLFGGGGDALTRSLQGAGLPAVGSFADGGYTGPGGRHEAAGIVHRGEYVMSAPAVQRIGLPNLEALHRGGAIGGRAAPGGAVSMTIDLRGTTGERALDEKIAQAGRAILKQVPGVMQDHQKRRP